MHMKRWVSVLLATIMLLIVASTGLFALAKSYVAPFNSYSAPVVYANPGVQVQAGSDQIPRVSNVQISYMPTLQFSYASWALADPSSKDAGRAYRVVSEELAKYDSSAITSTGLKKIYLVNSLYVDGTYRSGMPEAQFEDALYFDIDAKYFTSENGDYMRRTIHHELRHLADYNLYKSYRPQDSAWLQCNTGPTGYINSIESMYKDPTYAHASHPKTGFINGYATSGIDEDRAEVFAYYMTDRNYLYSQASDDASLSCKVAQTEQLLSRL